MEGDANSFQRTLPSLLVTIYIIVDIWGIRLRKQRAPRFSMAADRWAVNPGL